MQAIADLYERGRRHQNAGDLNAAVQFYKKVLALRADHAAARDRLGFIYLLQGKPNKASEEYAELIRTVPQILAQFDKVLPTLKAVIPALAEALADVSTARKSASPTDLLTAPAFNTIAGNPYFRVVLESAAVVDIALERWLTVVRAAILQAAFTQEKNADGTLLSFACSLAQQCFINEYVFAVTPEEAETVARLDARLRDLVSRGDAIDLLQLAALAMYTGLHTFPDAKALSARRWPPAIAAVVKQQIVEPLEEQRLRTTMPRLTAIGNGVTEKVRQQYEENPYPRWVRLGAPPVPLRVLDDYIRQQFPAASFRPTGKRDALDVLIAGCGTGRHALEVAQGYRGARVLGVDISLSSLANAKRHVPPALAGVVEFAQADILSLGSLDRTFDLINVGGVLHHMERPLAGWRELIKLMRPNGLMQVGLYSALARRDIIAVREMIAARGYPATAEGIRRCRQDLLNGSENYDFMRLRDFFTTSECRDLLFHVHEIQFTIPEINSFLRENDLNFIGFEFSPPEAHQYHHDAFARAGWSPTDLDRWDAYEREHPTLFAGMYVFWVQKLA